MAWLGGSRTFCRMVCWVTAVVGACQPRLWLQGPSAQARACWTGRVMSSIWPAGQVVKSTNGSGTDIVASSARTAAEGPGKPRKQTKLQKNERMKSTRKVQAPGFTFVVGCRTPPFLQLFWVLTPIKKVLISPHANACVCLWCLCVCDHSGCQLRFESEHALNTHGTKQTNPVAKENILLTLFFLHMPSILVPSLLSRPLEPLSGAGPEMVEATGTLLRGCPFQFQVCFNVEWLPVCPVFGIQLAICLTRCNMAAKRLVQAREETVTKLLSVHNLALELRA